MADRIQQGTDGQERLFTVRPRNASAVTEKRGTASSIRFHVPSDVTDTAPYRTGVDSATANAFNKAVTENGFINFIAQSVSYSIQEKSQVMHTFGGQEAVYFYGRAPIMVQLSGTIVDDLDNDQFAQFLGLYHNFLRGTKASENFSYVELGLNNISFTGAFMNISIQQQSDRDTDIQFSAQFLAKTFTIASTDSIFLDNGSINQPVVTIRDEDPTISQFAIQAVLDANLAASLTAVPMPSPNDPNSLATSGDGLFFGDFTKSFGTLPTISDLIGFSAGDITDFFGDVVDTISNITAPFEDALAQIDDFAQDAIGLVEAVEAGIDDVIHKIDSVTNQVYGTIDSVDDMITKITNFPDSMSSKLGAVGSSGGSGGSSLPVLGSPSIKGDEATSLLIPQSNTGASRGTPEGDNALIIVSGNSNQTASLSAGGDSNGDDEEAPTLSLATMSVRVGG